MKENLPQVEVNGTDVGHQLLGFKIKFTKVFHLQSAHFGAYQVLQKVVEHGDDPLGKKRVNEKTLYLWRKHKINLHFNLIVNYLKTTLFRVWLSQVVYDQKKL